MSAEAEVSEALQRPVDQNAESAEQVKQMLAELEGEAAPKAKSDATTNGNTEHKEVSTVEQNGEDSVKKGEPAAEPGEESEKKESTRDRSSDRRRGDRHDTRGRGRGRGGRGGRGGFTGRGGRYNIKSDVTTQEETDDPIAIRKQVEFYFSDSNLPRDQFLLTKVGGSQNNPVELKTLHTFKRMRHFQPFEAIVEAMRESTFLELCEDDTSVRRRDPLPTSLDNGPNPDSIQVFEDRAMPRSIYAKGFGEEKPSTQFDIESFFAEFGATNAVRLRRSDQKVFKGSVFVEFDAEETATKFLELDPKPQYEGRDLQIMSKKEYCDKKVEDIKSGKIRPNTSRNGPRRDDRGGRDFKRKRDDEDDRDWRVRRDEGRKHGFKDDRRGRRGDPDYTKGSRARYDKVEKDDRGVPVVKETADAGKDQKDAARADALAKAKAVVEEQTKKENDEKAAEAGEAAGPNGTAVPEATEAADDTMGKKRSREDDEGDTERATKKIDTGEVVES